MKTSVTHDIKDVGDLIPNIDPNNYPPKQNPFRILVADDDSSILGLFQQALSRVKTDPIVQSGPKRSKEKRAYKYTPDISPQSFDITTCRQGDETVDAVKKSIGEDRPFSVAFIDVKMPPESDGVWAAEQIRALDPNIEIVIVTGCLDVHLRDIARRVPPVHKLLYVQKPFQIQEISQFASTLSMKWLTARELQKVYGMFEKRVEEQTQDIKKAKEKLDGIIKSTTDHMTMVDEEHNVIWVNDIGKNLFGEGVVGNKCYKMYHGSKQPCEQCLALKTFADEKIHEQEKEVIGKDGNRMVFWATSSIAGRYEDGRPKYVVEILRDITDRKIAEENLQKTHKALELEFEERSQTLSDTLKKMEQKEKDLIQHKSDMQKLNKEMIETNRALSVLARNIDKNKELFEKKIYETTTVKILPIIKDLKSNGRIKWFMADLDVLETHLNSLFTGSKHLEIIHSLTDQEMRVAALIKLGLTNHKISDLLCISEHTVKTHRKNIRKKLKIKNSTINLSSYLKSNLPSVSM